MIICLMTQFSYFPGNEMLEIYYPADSLQLQEGDSLVLTCTIMYQRYESQGLDVYWCKQAENVFVCDRIDKEMEKKSLNESSNPKENDTFSILLQIHQLSQSDSGNYRCQGTSLKPVQFVMGHYITVHVTGKQYRNHLSFSDGNISLSCLQMWFLSYRSICIMLWVISIHCGLVPGSSMDNKSCVY
uniref:Ig-like domain-containing protein n=1 Tax=Anolis carolinensis TaxID=28377 RepID=A0A803SPQ9_ANOCA